MEQAGCLYHSDFFLIQDISLAFVKVASKAVQSEKYESQVNDGAAYFR